MKKLFLSILMLASIACASAQTLSENSIVSLMTCTPGKPLYLHFGHAAIRVQDPAFLMPDSTVGAIDWTFNYGLFSFDTEHFYWKFVKGETDYMLGLQYTEHFIASSNYDDREVFEQQLNLSLSERQQIFDALAENYLPENRVYRYNFVFDNCATRPLRLIEAALPSLQVPDTLIADSYRKQITYYAGKWSWGEFGINLCFGRQADKQMTLAESLFLPENLMNYMTTTGLVGEAHTGVFTPRDSSFWTSPYLLIILLVLLLTCITAWDWKRGKRCYVMDATLMLTYVILGAILTFLIFFSTHPFVRENVNFLFINLLWLFPLGCCFGPKGHKMLSKMGSPIFVYTLTACVLALFSGQTFHWLLIIPMLHSLRLFILSIHEKTTH